MPSWFGRGFRSRISTATTSPGSASSTLTYEIYKKALEGFNYGLAAAGGVLAIILANLVSIFLVRFVGDNLAD